MVTTVKESKIAPVHKRGNLLQSSKSLQTKASNCQTASQTVDISKSIPICIYTQKTLNASGLPDTSLIFCNRNERKKTGPLKKIYILGVRAEYLQMASD